MSANAINIDKNYLETQKAVIGENNIIQYKYAHWNYVWRTGQ